MSSRIYVDLTDTQALRMSKASKIAKCNMNEFVCKAVLEYIKKMESKEEVEEDSSSKSE